MPNPKNESAAKKITADKSVVQSSAKRLSAAKTMERIAEVFHLDDVKLKSKSRRGRPPTKDGIYSTRSREAAEVQAREWWGDDGSKAEAIRQYVRDTVRPMVVRFEDRAVLVDAYRSKNAPCLGLRIRYAIECIQVKENLPADADVCRFCMVSHSVLVKLKQSTDPGRSDKRRRAVLEKISGASGLSVDWLMCGTGGPPPEIQRLL